MALTERLQILIDADSKGAQRELAAFGRTAEKGLGESEKKLQMLSGQMVAFGSATLVGGTVAAAGLYKLADAASDLGEATNAANVTLGKAGARALEDYAKTASQTAGISKRAALEYGASFALFVQNAGYVGEEAGNVSSDLVQLAGDISSLRNVPVEEALVSLRSALAGESEAIRRLGIDTSDAALKNEIFERTGQKVTGTLSQQVRTQEIINKLFKDGSVFQGDFVNTSDELANRQRALAAELENTAAAAGEALLPAFQAIVGGAQGVLGAFNALPDTAQRGIAGFAGVATAATLAAGGLSLAVGVGLRAVDTFSDLSGRLRNASGALATAGKIGAGVGVVGAGLAGIAALDQALVSSIGAADDLAESINQIKLASDDLARSRAVDSAIEASFNSQIDLSNLLTQNFSESKAVQDAFNEALGDSAATAQLFLDTVRNSGSFEIVGKNELVNLQEQRDEILLTETELEQWQGKIDEKLQLDIKAAYAQQQYTSAVAKGVAELEAGGDASGKSADGALDDAAAKEQARVASEKLKSTLAKLTAQQKLSTLAFDIGAARADSFAAALERSTSADNLLASAAGAGRALSDLRRTLGLVPEDAEETAETVDLAAEAMERLNYALERTDPSLSQLSIQLGASGAAAQAFGSSLDQAGRFGDKLEAALGLGDAFTEFRKTFRRLPDDIDIAAVSLGKLRPRTAEAVRGVLALGDATRDYLQSLIESGASYDEVRSESARLRAEYAAQFAQLGLTAEQLDEYIRLTGTAPDQIETAIRLAGVEGARFKLQAYLGLLEGRIPPEVATSIVPLIESGNLEAAAAQLAAFASTNPAKIDVAPTGTKELDEVEGTITDLPRKYDALKAATGGYSEANLDALEGVLSLGDAYRDFLTEVVADDPQKAIGYAQELRDQFALTVAGLGLTKEELDSYYQLLGIAPEQIETAIELSNFDATVFRITTMISLLEGIGEMSPETILKIDDALAREAYDEVTELLTQEVTGTLNADPQPAYDVWGAWDTWVKNTPTVNPMWADTAPAVGSVEWFRQWIGRTPAVLPVEVQIGQVRTADGRTWGSIDAAINNGAGRVEVPGAGGADGNPATPWPRARGGRTMPNRDYLVGENGPEIARFGSSAMVIPADQTAAMMSPPPLARADAANNRMMLAELRDAIAEMNSGSTTNDITVVAPAPELAGVALIRELRKRNYLGVG